MKGLLTWFRRIIDGAPIVEDPGFGASIEMPDEDAEMPSRGLTSSQLETLDSALSVLATGLLPVEGDHTTAELLPTGEGYRYGAWTATARRGDLAEVLVAFYDAGGWLSISADGAPASLRVVLDAVYQSARIPNGFVDSRVSALGVALRDAGRDPRMKAAQRDVHRKRLWGESFALCLGLDLRRPLSWLAVLDLCADPWPPDAARARRRLGQLQALFEELPPSAGGDEERWTKAMLLQRLAWMRGSSRPEAKQGAARAEALLRMVRTRQWELRRPFTLAGVEIP